MSDNRWIVWQNACEKMHHAALTDLRDLLKSKAVVTHSEILEMVEDIYHPLMPKETIDIDAEDPPTSKQMPPPVCSIERLTSTPHTLTTPSGVNIIYDSLMEKKSMNDIIFKDMINKALIKRGYTIDYKLEWADIEPKSMQDDSFICASILILEELSK